MKDKIANMLDEKVNEIFLAMQNDLGIKNGDVSPMDAYDLDNCRDELAEIIERILKNQI